FQLRAGEQAGCGNPADGAAAAQPASPRYYRSLDAELNLSAELGGGFFLRWISRLSEALLRRPLEARLQGPLAEGALSLLQSNRRCKDEYQYRCRASS